MTTKSAGIPRNVLGRRTFLTGLAALGGPAAIGQHKAVPDSRYLETSNGWYIQNGKMIWGYARHNQWWGGFRSKYLLTRGMT